MGLCYCLTRKDEGTGVNAVSPSPISVPPSFSNHKRIDFVLFLPGLLDLGTGRHDLIARQRYDITGDEEIVFG